MGDGELYSTETIDWLLAGDPAVRFGVMRDLLDADASSLAHEQSLIATSGWGARLLEKQDTTGTWSGSLYSPKFTSTHFTLLTLRHLGLSQDHPGARKAAQVLLDTGVRHDGGINFGGRPDSPSETCISGMSLSLYSYFRLVDPRVTTLAEYLLSVQMPDGGWNCRHLRGATHSSFHTTASALEGLRDFHLAHPGHGLPVSVAVERGREFFLQHKLYRSHRTGEVVNESMTRFPFPPMWQHDVLRVLDHFAAVDAPRDERLQDPIDLVSATRDATGRYPQHRARSGKYHFTLETEGKPGRMNTLRALRVLRWWAA